MVLFGPNDAGKTNLLEAFELALGLGPSSVRRDPSRREDFHDDFCEVMASVELEDLDVDGSADREFLRTALLAFFSWPEDEWPEEDRDSGWSLADLSEDVLSNDDRQNINWVISLVFNLMLDWAEKRCSDWQTVAEDYRSVLEACFECRQFRFYFEGGEWLLPGSYRWRGRLREACERLARQRDLWDNGLVPFVDPVLDLDTEDAFFPFLRFGNDVRGNAHSLLNGYASFVRATTPSETTEFLSDIEEFVDQQYFHEDVPITDFTTGETRVERLSLVGSATEFGGWLEREGEADVIRASAREGCAELSAEATRIAPPFVRGRYEIVIRPLLGSERADFSGRKVQIALRERAGERMLDLSVAGSGTRTWAQYSIREAMRTLARARAPSGEEQPRMTIYVVDEPERHLHPTAQEEVAQWIADRVGDGAGAIIATHAPPFLDLPYEGTEYYCVARDGEGTTTRATRVTEDLLGAIAESAAEMGLSPVHAVQLTRAWLVVEGDHDVRVLRHFYGRELNRARVAILPLRGVKEALALLQLGHLSTIGKPLYVIFDSVRAEWVTGGTPPTGLPSREEKEVDQLRRLWTDENVDLRVEPFSAPDIICALPPDAVERALADAFRGRAGTFPGWRPIVESYEAAGSKGRFKDFALKQMQLSATADEFIKEVLERSDRTPLLGSELHRSIEHILASS